MPFEQEYEIYGPGFNLIKGTYNLSTVCWKYTKKYYNNAKPCSFTRHINRKGAYTDKPWI